MVSSISDIRDNIRSNNVDVLKQSLEFARACLADERDRGKAAETRAAATLAVLGVIAGLVVPQAQTLGAIDNDSGWFLVVGYIAPLAFLVWGLICALRVLAVSKRYRNKPERVFAFPEYSYKDALREEIAAIIWEYRHTVEPTTNKLYWLDRCQRSGVKAIILLAGFAVAVIVVHQEWFEIPCCMTVAFAVLVSIVFARELLAARGGIWSGWGKRGRG